MNILFISIDSLRYDYLGCYGNHNVQTPNIDYLAKNGIQCNQAISQAPGTLTSHTSMLSGLYPFHHGLRTYKDLISENNPDKPMIFGQLLENGYSVNSLLGEGIDTFLDKLNPEWAKCNYKGISTLDNIETIMKANQNNSFFLFIHYWGVHTPYLTYLPIGNRKELLINTAVFLESRGIKSKWSSNVLSKHWSHRVNRVRDMMGSKDKYIDKIQKGYRRAINHMDKYIGEIISLLKSHSMLENTFIVFTGDHGESFNEHNEREETDQYEHGCFLWETLIRVPLIIYSPQLINSLQIDFQVESVDIVPTLYDIINIAPTNQDELDGKNLVKMALDEDLQKKYTYSEALPSDIYTIRTEKYKVIDQFSSDDRQQLFNLEDDPGETKNLIEHNPTIAQQIKSEFNEQYDIYHRINQAEAESYDNDDVDDIEDRLKGLGYL